MRERIFGKPIDHIKYVDISLIELYNPPSREPNYQVNHNSRITNNLNVVFASQDRSSRFKAIITLFYYEEKLRDFILKEALNKLRERET